MALLLESPMPKPKQQPEPTPRTLADVLADVESWQAEAEAAKHEFDQLREQRKASLLTASIDEIAAFDVKLARADARGDRAQAHLERLQVERQDVAAAESEDRLHRDLKLGAELCTEAERLISVDYVEAAVAVAEALARLTDLERQANDLNSRLPFAQRIKLTDFRGVLANGRMVVDHLGNPWIPSMPSLLEAVKLPSVHIGQADFWPARMQR
jgi:hypothetical protein